MKKLLAVTVCALMILTMSVFSASAATIDDVVAAVAANPLLAHLAGDVRNIARNYDFTPEQYDQIVGLINSFNADVEINYDELGNLDLGSMTPEELIQAGTNLIKDAASVAPEYGLGAVVSTPGGKIENTTITVVDKQGDVVMVIDKNVVQSTAFVESEANSSSNGLDIAILAVSLAGVLALLCVSRKAKAGK